MLDGNENQNVETEVKIKKEKKPKFNGFFKFVSAGVIGSVLTLAVAPQLNYFGDDQVKSAVSEKAATVEGTESSLNLKQVIAASTSIADIVEQASDAIVGITNIQKQQVFTSFGGQGLGQNRSGGQESDTVESGTGSGVIYQVTDGALYIVTNYHVIEDASKIEVTLSDEKVVTAELIGSDALTDLAVLKVNGSYTITPLTFGDSSKLRAGVEVIAIGNPLGLDLYGTVTQGIVSAVDRTIETSTTAGISEMKVIQTDAAINPGNSGGALINTAGEVVGINSMKIAEENVEGLGFAIPSNDVTKIINELTENGQIIRPYLGISMVNLSEVPQSYLQNVPSEVTEGVVIAEVDVKGAAAKAGIQKEDIIVSINNQKITQSSELRDYLYTKLSVGDTATIQFYRQGKLMDVDVTLTSNNNK